MKEERPLKNVAASIRQRLLNRARERGEEFGWVLSRYAVERLLYRLSRSEHAEGFILKGAQLFTLWTTEPYRPTRDLDLLRQGDPSVAHLESIFCALCSQTVDVPDGIDFLADTVKGEEIREHAEYGGVRVCLTYHLAGAKDALQIDMGVGDAVTPAPQVVAYPSVLGLPTPRLRAYPRETVVAEKLQAMVALGIANSRMKDFLDLHVLAASFAFDGHTLSEAIAATFARRRTALPTTVPLALTQEFAADAAKRTQWQAFVRRSGPRSGAPSLGTVVESLQLFLAPPLASLSAGRPFAGTWPPSGPWQS